MEKLPSKLSLFGSTFLRYFLAVLCAFLTPYILILILPAIKLDRISLNAISVIEGFVWVFLPSFILPRKSRVSCAVFLFIFGMFYYSICVFDYERPVLLQIPELLNRTQSVSLLSGGLIAVGIHCYWARQKKHERKP
jgi:hypothetical protein